ncbi:MAG: FecR domain-containing protein [Spirochaetales bacterium]|nr:FecR domain-containing protein [Spirochaetales bacterium]
MTERCLRMLAVLVFSLAVQGLVAQDKAAAMIEFSSGEDIVVIRAGRRLPTSDPIGLELYQGDQIQTGRGVFVELRVLAGSSLIKLAENTTFVLERLSDGETSLRLVYGRIRAKVTKLAGSDTFTVASAQAIAGVRGTDFGVDVVATKAMSVGATTTRAYCFEGAVEVTAFVQPGSLADEGLEPIPRAYIVNAGEMLKVEGDARNAEATKESLDDAIREYWKANDYVEDIEADETPSVAATPTEPEAPVVDERAIFERGYAEGYAVARAEFEPAPDYVPAGYISESELEEVRDAARLQAGGIVAASLIGVGGAAMAAWGGVQAASGDSAGAVYSLTTAAYISAAAIPFLILALFANP